MAVETVFSYRLNKYVSNLLRIIKTLSWGQGKATGDL